LVDGEPVRVFNDLGSVTMPVRVDATVRPGVCQVPKGVWLRDYAGGRSLNVLVANAKSDLAAGACFNDAQVEVSGLK
jgi:anaerobic selenocysteine-containing dehydrogenase